MQVIFSGGIYGILIMQLNVFSFHLFFAYRKQFDYKGILYKSNRNFSSFFSVTHNNRSVVSLLPPELEILLVIFYCNNNIVIKDLHCLDFRYWYTPKYMKVVFSDGISKFIYRTVFFFFSFILQQEMFRHQCHLHQVCHIITTKFARNSSFFKVHLTPNFFSLKRIQTLFEAFGRRNF